MKVPQVLAEIVSEFSGLNHTPDFKAVRSMPNCRCSRPCSRACSRSGSRANSRAPSGASSPVRKHSGERKYSTMITIGADDLPTPPNGEVSISEGKFQKHHSSPCFSNIVCSKSLKDKLEKIKRTNSSSSFKGLKEEREKEREEEQEDFHCNMKNSPSTSSYRLP